MSTPDDHSHANRALKKARKPPTARQLAALKPMPTFEPTEEQRAFVLKMAGFKSMNADEIRSLVINPRTGEPISRDSLFKHFRHEIDTGKQNLKALIGKRYIDKLEAGEWPAIHFGMKNIMGYTDEPAGALSVSATPEDGIQISFVLPSKRED